MAAPTVSSVAVNTAGTTITVTFDQAVTIGAGGSGGFRLHSAGIGSAQPLTHSSGDGTTTHVFTRPHWVISSHETLTLAYVTVANGMENAGGEDLASFTGQAVTNNSTQTLNATFTVRTRTPGHEVGTAITMDARGSTLGESHSNEHVFRWTITAPSGTVLHAGLDRKGDTTRPAEVVPLEGKVMMFVPEEAGDYSIVLTVYDGDTDTTDTASATVTVAASTRTATYTDTDLTTGDNDGTSWANAYQSYAALRNAQRTNDNRHHYIRGSTDLVGSNTGDWQGDNVVIEGVDNGSGFPAVDITSGAGFRVNQVSKFTIKNIRVKDTTGTGTGEDFIRRGNTHSWEDFALLDIQPITMIDSGLENNIDTDSLLVERWDNEGQTVRRYNFGIFTASADAFLDVFVCKDSFFAQSSLEHCIRLNMPGGTPAIMNVVCEYGTDYATNKTGLRTQSGRWCTYLCCEVRGAIVWGGDGRDTNEARVSRCLLSRNEYAETVAIEPNENTTDIDALIGFYACVIRNTDRFGESDRDDNTAFARINGNTTARFHNCVFVMKGDDGYAWRTEANATMQMRGCVLVIDVGDTDITDADTIPDNGTRIFNLDANSTIVIENSTFSVASDLTQTDVAGPWNIAYNGTSFAAFMPPGNEEAAVSVDADWLVSGASSSAPESGVIEDYYGTPVDALPSGTFRGSVFTEDLTLASGWQQVPGKVPPAITASLVVDRLFAFNTATLGLDSVSETEVLDTATSATRNTSSPKLGAGELALATASAVLEGEVTIDYDDSLFVALWLDRLIESGTRMTIVRHGSNASPRVAFNVLASTGRPQLVVWNSSGVPTVINAAGLTMPIAGTHRAAGFWIPGGGNEAQGVKIWVNGDEYAAAAAAGTLPSGEATADLAAGGTFAGTSAGAVGYYDALVLKSGLTAAQARDLWEAYYNDGDGTEALLEGVAAGGRLRVRDRAR